MPLPEQSTADETERMRRMLERLETGLEFPDSSIVSLCEAHQALCDALREFDPVNVIRLISTLETFPQLHGNTIRIEVLLHLAVACCNGMQVATPGELRNWASLMEDSPMGSLEDPSEDVFVGYICTPSGGFRCYPGIFSNADYILERLLDFIARKADLPGFRETYESVLELLRISDAITNDLGQARYSAGRSSAGHPIQIPPDDQLSRHSSAVNFSSERLLGLGVDLTKLDPFLFKPEHKHDFNSKPLFGSPLENQPLFAIDEGFIVASPSCLCRAAAVHILKAASTGGGWVDSLFCIESAHIFVNEIVSRLGIRPISSIRLPTAPESLPPFIPMVGQFDYGMPVLALTNSSSLAQGFDLEEIEAFTAEQVEDLTRHVAECCAACEAVEGFKGGLILMASSSIGRPVAFGIGELRPNWYLFSSSLADWQTLACDEDFTAKRLWYLALQQEAAKIANLEIANTSGLLNLYGFWKSNNFSLIHQSVNVKNPHNVLAIDGAFSLQVNNELKSIYDRHCQCTCDGAEWVTLQRKGPGLNPDLRTNLMYSDYESASKGLLRGCVEHQNCAWWVKSSTRPENPGARNLLIRLWDCVFNWMEHIVSVLSAEHPKWRPGRLELELEFPGIETWQIEDTAKLTGTPADLSFHFDPATATARLIFVQKFLPKFYRADNLAEREIVSAIVRCSAGIARVEVPESELQRIVACVTKNQDSRFFHIVSSKTLESALGGPEHATPAFIPLEEISRVHIGLAHRVFNDPRGRITIQSEAQVFLDKIVANLQGSLVNRLKQFNILPIVSHSFSQLDELSRDRTRWSLSTRSLFALEEGAAWLQDRLRTESGRLARAEIANRVLIETAVYSYEPGATEIVSQTEHASLLAQIAVMIELANHRDAIAGGFVAADLKIHPNGMIEFDDSFQREVFQPYLTSRVDDRIRWDAETYDTNFEPPVTEPTPSDEVSPQAGAFERAFLAEFGFSYGKITSIIDYFYNTAVSQGEGGGTLDSRAFRYLLKHEIGLTDPQIDSFVERFVLPIRPGWNKNLPEGCDANDVLPWRYFRGLSVLVRPFVEVARSPRRFAFWGGHLHRWRHYLTHSILNGYLPEKLFRSTAMKSYLGSIADKRGHDFTEELAERLAKFLPNRRVEIKMATLGAPSNPDMGDIDLLTWEPTSGAVFVIECKRLKAALTVRQVIQQLEEFRGNPIEMDSLAKHQRRVEWLRNNPAKLSQITGIPESDIQWIPLLVTKGRVPMSFLDAIEFPKEQIVPDQQIEQYISTLVYNKRHSKM